MQKESTNKLNLTYLYQNQVAKEILINENFATIDSVVFKSCKDIVNDLDNLSPQESDLYILNTNNKLCIFLNNSWRYISPIDGMKFYVLSQNKEYLYLNSQWNIVQTNNTSTSNNNGALIDDLTASNISVYSSQKSDAVYSKKTDVYTKIETDTTINTLATKANTYTKGETFALSNLFNEIIGIANKKTVLTNIFSSVDYNFIKTLLQIPDPAIASGNNITGDYKYSAQNADHGNWLICDKRAISRTTYSALFALIGTSFGIGDNTTTFNLPDFRGRVAAGVGQGLNLTNRNLGQSIGEENHTLTINEMPSHSHTMGPTGGVVNNQSGSDGAGSGSNRTVSYATNNTGGNVAHNNMQPTLFGGNWFIFVG